MHPRNKHTGRYDLAQLSKSCPSLLPFLTKNPRNEPTIDFSDPAAVKTLNSALLKHFYHVDQWDIPEGYLCPPIPGRADYIHQAADLLSHDNRIPQGPNVYVLDIGVGANCIYPIIGNSEYGWRFVGSDTDPVALASARKIVDAHKALRESVQCRQQLSPSRVFNGLIRSTDLFDLSICNPPFHASAQDVVDASLRKWKNLGRAPSAKKNFGGQPTELWCPGGEAAFLRQMILESKAAARHVLWFSAIVSKEDHLHGLQKLLKRQEPAAIRVLDMSLGQKKSRILAWTFFDEAGQKEWRQRRG